MLTPRVSQKTDSFEFHRRRLIFKQTGKNKIGSPSGLSIKVLQRIFGRLSTRRPTKARMQRSTGAQLKIVICKLAPEWHPRKYFASLVTSATDWPTMKCSSFAPSLRIWCRQCGSGITYTIRLSLTIWDRYTHIFNKMPAQDSTARDSCVTPKTKCILPRKSHVRVTFYFHSVCTEFWTDANNTWNCEMYIWILGYILVEFRWRWGETHKMLFHFCFSFNYSNSA